MAKHAKLSASGAERWLNCPGSVSLSEGLPDIETEWSREGTLAHSFLEKILKEKISFIQIHWSPSHSLTSMFDYALDAAQFIWKVHRSLPGSEVTVENKVSLSFISPDMFGTLDSSVIDYFGTLHIFDFKYGQGHFVSPKENLQMIFYALGTAHKFDWNFSKVRLWIIQPRVKGYDGPLYWDISILDLMKYIGIFKAGVERVERYPKKYVEGSWCWFCKAKKICPLKVEKKQEKLSEIFKSNPY